METKSSAARWPRDRCVICGNINCLESVDHLHLNLQQLETLIGEAKHNRLSIDLLKQKVTSIYSTLKNRLIEKIDQDEEVLQLWINELYYPHLASKTNLRLLAQLTEGLHQSLPTHAVKHVVKTIKRRSKPSLSNSEVGDVLNEITFFLQKLNIQAITDKPLRYLAAEQLISLPQLRPMESRKSFSELSISEESSLVPSVYEWKNIKINKNSRVAEFSNKNLRDEDIVREIPTLSCFKNLKEFEVRNNYLTSLSCKIIVNNLNFIQTLDIRGNRIGDSGLTVIAAGLPKLKNLLISETEATDEGGRKIAESMSHLQLFWAQNNHISGEVILEIASKSKLKVMSVTGNPIDDRHKSLLHQLFVRKGYLVI